MLWWMPPSQQRTSASDTDSDSDTDLDSDKDTDSDSDSGRNLRQVAADCGKSRQIAASCRRLQQIVSEGFLIQGHAGGVEWWYNDNVNSPQSSSPPATAEKLPSFQSWPPAAVPPAPHQFAAPTLMRRTGNEHRGDISGNLVVEQQVSSKRRYGWFGRAPHQGWCRKLMRRLGRRPPAA